LLESVTVVRLLWFLPKTLNSREKGREGLDGSGPGLGNEMGYVWVSLFSEDCSLGT